MQLRVFIFLIALGSHFSSFAEEIHFQHFKDIPIQHGGRIKPVDTFAREVLQLVSGKTRIQKQEAVDVIFSWLLTPEKWSDAPIIQVGSYDLKKTLGLNLNQRYFSAEELLKIPSLDQHINAVQEKNQREEKLTPLDKAIEQLAMQLMALEKTSQGEWFTLIPHPEGPTQNWFSLALLLSSDSLNSVYASLEARSKVDELRVTFKGMADAYRANDEKTFSVTSHKFKSLLSELSSQPGYPYVTTLSTEIFYNQFRPFRKAWIFYVTSVLLFLLYFAWGRNSVVGGAACGTLLVSFLIHVLGFYIRCSITGRPPVGNMYESVVWVSLGVMVFSLILFYLYRQIFILAVAATVSGIGLILADQLPTVLDPTIRPLAPVLRNNFWLTIHVLTITLSYAAFSLAMGLGNWALFKFIGASKKKEELKKIILGLNRTIQIGVLLLAAGTILGGVWADYSWGRFWGWDPKEVWALIALLLYLGIVHGRYAGWLKDFGLAAGSVLAFQGVLMAWYGVNFVLGVGLHSYGFGSGGLIYVLFYVLLQVAFVVFSYLKSYTKIE